MIQSDKLPPKVGRGQARKFHEWIMVKSQINLPEKANMTGFSPLDFSHISHNSHYSLTLMYYNFDPVRIQWRKSIL